MSKKVSTLSNVIRACISVEDPRLQDNFSKCGVKQMHIEIHRIGGKIAKEYCSFKVQSASADPILNRSSKTSVEKARAWDVILALVAPQNTNTVGLGPAIQSIHLKTRIKFNTHDRISVIDSLLGRVECRFVEFLLSFLSIPVTSFA